MRFECVLPQRRFRFCSHAPTGHRIPAQGANPGNPPGKRNPRSEGTPHSCVSRISTPTFPMRCSFRTHLFFQMRFPGRCPGLVCVTPSGYMVRSRFPIPCLIDVAWGPSVETGASVPGYSGAARLTERLSERFLSAVRMRFASTSVPFSFPCPNGASHTSPGCEPWESSRKKRPAF